MRTISKLVGTVTGASLSVMLALAPASQAFGADAPGCKDPAGLKRFEGSALVLCEARDFGEYQLPTGKLLAWDYNTKRPSFESSIALEGKPAFQIYKVPKGPSSAEVFRNYELDLADKGFQVLYKAAGLEFGFDQGRIFEHMGPGGQLFGYSPTNARYASAVKDDGDLKTYVSLYVIEFEGGLHPKISAERGQVLVRLDVVQVGQLKDRMVVVSASDMQKAIDTTGRVTLYGILFDFNKWEIKPQSKPALDEIAKYMTANPERRLHVVGHTDAVGGFDFNVKLSQQRANAVVSALVRDYGIGADRLKGNGVGMLAPIATNGTDEGRAKNRRVELVPQ